MRLIYRHDVIRILYKQMWFISALSSLFSNRPAGSPVSVLSCELNGQGSCPACAVFFGYLLLLAYYSFFFMGRLGVVGLGFSIRVSVKCWDQFYVYSLDSKPFWIAIDMFVY